jgi:alcohol dehydrogenase, propanol-preferring
MPDAAMRVMALQQPGAGVVVPLDVPTPVAGSGQLLIRVLACGVCRTDLHVVDGDLPARPLPVVPGHEIVGRVEAVGDAVQGFAPGDRVGVPWLGYTCQMCAYCRSGRENLCRAARFTGYDLPGGYAEWTVADARFCFALPDQYDDAHLAPLLCAGLIGYRAYRMAGPGTRLGLYGFGAAAHILAQIARQDGREVYAFTRPGDAAAAELALRLGANWAGPSDARSPTALDAAIIFAPVGALVPAALAHTAPGATVVCAGIHMSDIPSFAYRLLWDERVVRSVANLTREDARDFLALVARVPLHTEIHQYDLGQANRALGDLRAGQISGAAVLVPEEG